MYYGINAKQKVNDEVVDGGVVDSDVFFETQHAKRMQLENECSSPSSSVPKITSPHLDERSTDALKA